jgi:hypothetical protein
MKSLFVNRTPPLAPERLKGRCQIHVISDGVKLPLRIIKSSRIGPALLFKVRIGEWEPRSGRENRGDDSVVEGDDFAPEDGA